MPLFDPLDTADMLSVLVAHISYLSVAEIDHILSKGDETPLDGSDEEMALALFAQEAGGLLSMAKAHLLVEQDLSHEERLFEELLEVEEMARFDRAMALALSEGRDPPTPPERPIRIHTNNPKILSSELVRHSHGGLGGMPEPLASDKAAGTVSRDSSRSPSRGDTPSPGAERLVNRPRPKSPEGPPNARFARIHKPGCIVCGDVIETPVMYLACGHLLDTHCLRTMFENATKDESLYPPKCCQDRIELARAREYLDASLVTRYEEKVEEYETPDRVYCHNRTCSAFLGAASSSGSGSSSASHTATAMHCERCDCATCGCCKEKAHPGRRCTAAEDEEAMLQLGREQGWQRCSSCMHLVERVDGCYHMRCRCRKEFCYLCGATWKTCECSIFEVPAEDY